jgi:hypothetical protein
VQRSVRQRDLVRWIAGSVLLLALAGLAALLLFMTGLPWEGPPARRALVTRILAITFVACDVAVSASLITLLVLQDRRAPVWMERRLPTLGRWLWHFLLGLVVLCYVSLAPTFLYLYLHMRP